MNIVLGVCGSISAYKTYELLRLYLKEDINLKVILTKGASKFVHANILKSLGAIDVYSYEDDFKAIEDVNILHIDLVKWMDKMVIAPASANTIAKLSSGLSDDLLTSVVLAATQKEIHIYPAMNTQMLDNEITQLNFRRLSKAKNIKIHDTQIGELACKDVGQGKLATVEHIFNSSTLSTNGHKGVVTITTGATVAPLDTVRYLTNPSSGLTGIEMAKSFLKAGYKVNLICGHNMQNKVQHFEKVSGLCLFHANTADKMLEFAQKYFNESDVYISAAAICDIKFQTQNSKIKKDTLDGTLLYEKEIDILKTLSKLKSGQKIIGFAAESELNEDKLKDKMLSKEMDILIANIVDSGITNMQKGFNQEANDYLIIHDKLLRKNMTKKQLADFIVNKVEAL